jgi:hypothetical protein
MIQTGERCDGLEKSTWLLGQAACRRASTCVSQTAIWFQLANVWFTTLSVTSLAWAAPDRCPRSLRARGRSSERYALSCRDFTPVAGLRRRRSFAPRKLRMAGHIARSTDVTVPPGEQAETKDRVHRRAADEPLSRRRVQADSAARTCGSRSARSRPRDLTFGRGLGVSWRRVCCATGVWLYAPGRPPRSHQAYAPRSKGAACRANN